MKCFHLNVASFLYALLTYKILYDGNKYRQFYVRDEPSRVSVSIVLISVFTIVI